MIKIEVKVHLLSLTDDGEAQWLAEAVANRSDGPRQHVNKSKRGGYGVVVRERKVGTPTLARRKSMLIE